jgi:hypothetical protein
MEHVLESELTAIWKCIRATDVMVLYQHQTNRNATPWIEPKRAQFERAIGIPFGAAKVGRGNSARDVAFFIASKSW